MEDITINPAEIKVGANQAPRSLLHIADDLYDSTHDIETMLRHSLYFLNDLKGDSTTSKVVENLCEALNQGVQIKKCLSELSNFTQGVAA